MPPYSVSPKEREQTGKLQFCLNIVFYVVLVLIAFETGDCLIGTTQLKTERLGATENIPVGIGDRSGSAKVARSIGTFRLETDAVATVGTQLYVAVEHQGVARLDHTDISITEGIKTSEGIIGFL